MAVARVLLLDVRLFISRISCVPGWHQGCERCSMLKASPWEGADGQWVEELAVLSWHAWPAEEGPDTSSEIPVHVGPWEVRKSGLFKRHPHLSSSLILLIMLVNSSPGDCCILPRGDLLGSRDLIAHWFLLGQRLQVVVTCRVPPGSSRLGAPCPRRELWPPCALPVRRGRSSWLLSCACALSARTSLAFCACSCYFPVERWSLKT